jgi:16S rRNA (guanine527-N7)-methyltransferase
MELTQTARYTAYGLDIATQHKLASLGDCLLGAGFNVTGVTEPVEIERIHFLDSLSLLTVESVRSAALIADVGSGAGLPALVLALALPARVTALESQRKKCEFITRTARSLGLENVDVYCGRAEDFGRGSGREVYDVVVSRALAALPVVAEYSLPLLRTGGRMVAMQGAISAQERRQADKAVAILGADRLQRLLLDPFPGARNRQVFVARKVQATPLEYPRRTGIPAKRPLGV